MDITSNDLDAFKVVIVAAVLIFMQFLMVGGRFLSKLRKVPLAADDYVLVAAAILTIGLCALAIAFPRIAGIMVPIAITQMEESPKGKLLGQSFMAWLILYGLSIALSKCAILLLYVRVFTTGNKPFVIGVCLTGFVVMATGLANTFVAIFQCHPIAYEWDKTIQGGKCIDEVAFTRYMTIPNVVTGAIMLVIPLPLSWRLNLTVSARIGLTATFLHGIIGFVASCARLIIFFRTDASSFTENTSLAWTIWTITEPANYTIAACLPTLRPIFQRLLLSSSSSVLRKAGKRPSARTRLRRNPALLEAGPRRTSPWMHQRWSWVDLEATSRDGHHFCGDGGTGCDDEVRQAVTRVPGCEADRGQEEEVVERMVEVVEGGKPGFF